MLFNISVHGTEYQNQTLQTIYKHRNNPTLLILCNKRKYRYAAFSRLAGIKKLLLRLHENIDIEQPERSSSDLQRPFVKHFQSSSESTPEESIVQQFESPTIFQSPNTSNFNFSFNNTNNSPNSNPDSNTYTMNTHNMASTVNDDISFFKFAASLIPIYHSNVEALDSFISNVRLVDSMTSDCHKSKFVKFVYGRLIGKASKLCQYCSTIDEIINQLEGHITDEPSLVLESKLDALTFDYKNLSEFCSQAEVLADKCVNALVEEGCTRSKATTMIITKLINICRKSARNETIKAILASSSFCQPRDVLSKFRTEIALAHKENPNSIRPPNNHMFNRFNRPSGSFQTYNNNSYNNPRAFNQNFGPRFPNNNNYNNNSMRPNHFNYRGNQPRQPSFVRVAQWAGSVPASPDTGVAQNQGNEEAARWPNPQESQQ